jgi:hypothetical protein
MGPLGAASQAQAPEEKDPAIAKLQEDYGKLVEAPELADVVLLVEGERFPAHRLVRWWRGSSTFAGCCCRGCRREADSRRSRWGR